MPEVTDPVAERRLTGRPREHRYGRALRLWFGRCCNLPCATAARRVCIGSGGPSPIRDRWPVLAGKHPLNAAPILLDPATPPLLQSAWKRESPAPPRLRSPRPTWD